MIAPERALRYLVIILRACATVGMALISMRANYLFGYGFGQTPEKAAVFAWANVAADAWKIAGLLLITTLWRAHHRSHAIVLLPLWLACLLWGLASAIGVYAQDRTALVGAREGVSLTYRDLEHDIARLDAELDATTGRTAAELDALIAAMLARPIMSGERLRGTVGKISGACTKDDRATADACAAVARLRAERAASQRRVELEQARMALRAKLHELHERGGTLPADPVAEHFAWLFRGQLSVRDISFGFPLVFALLIELVSAFGPAGIAAYASATRHAQARQSPTQPVMSRVGALRPTPSDSIVEWMAERTEPTLDASGITIVQLYADYEDWCSTKNGRALSLARFAHDFEHLCSLPELGGRITRIDDKYFGLQLLRVRALIEDSRK